MGPENDGQPDAETIAGEFSNEDAAAGRVTTGACPDVPAPRGRADGRITDATPLGLSKASCHMPVPSIRLRLDLRRGPDARASASAAHGIRGAEALAGYGSYRADVVDVSRRGSGGGLAFGLGRDDVVRGFGDVRIDGGASRDALEVDPMPRRSLDVGGTAEQAGSDAPILGDDFRSATVTGVETVAFGTLRPAAVEVVSAWAPSLLLAAEEDATVTGGTGDDRIAARDVNARPADDDAGDAFPLRFSGGGDVVVIANPAPGVEAVRREAARTLGENRARRSTAARRSLATLGLRPRGPRSFGWAGLRGGRSARAWGP